MRVYNIKILLLFIAYRCLGLLSNMKAFRACCPFNKEIRGEIITALRKGTLEWLVLDRTFFISSSLTLCIFLLRSLPLNNDVGFLFRYEDTRQQTMCYDKEPDQDADKVLQDFTNLVTALLVDLEQGLTYYNSLFERWAFQISQFPTNWNLKLTKLAFVGKTKW